MPLMLVEVGDLVLFAGGVTADDFVAAFFQDGH